MRRKENSDKVCKLQIFELVRVLILYIILYEVLLFSSNEPILKAFGCPRGSELQKKMSSCELVVPMAKLVVVK